jgi:hypothetical protein
MSASDDHPLRLVIKSAVAIQTWTASEVTTVPSPSPLMELRRLRALCLRAGLPVNVSVLEMTRILDRLDTACQNAAAMKMHGTPAIAEKMYGTPDMRASLLYLSLEIGRAMSPLVDLIEALEPREEGSASEANPEPTIPYDSPLSVKDLTRLLREKGHAQATTGAVDRFLRRYRQSHPDCYKEQDRDDRRRNEPKYLHRPEVLPALFEHFSVRPNGRS